MRKGSTVTVVTATTVDLDGFTVADLESLPDDGLRCELEDGCLIVSPSEVVRNDSAAVQLGAILLAFEVMSASSCELSHLLD